MTKSVLGLFDNEDEFCNYLAENLTIIESGLCLIKKNFAVSNPHGASGAFDILAKDKFDNYVIIEVKRSDQAARHALHELSKYIALFMEDQKIDGHKIRCFVVSTHWHELDVPLSFFKDVCPVEINGFEVAAIGQAVTAKKRTLPKVSLESRLSPDMRFSFFDSVESQNNYCDDLTRALSGVPYVRAALVVMEPIANRQRMCLLCAWRVPDIAFDNVKALIFNPDFQEEHYFFSGWELETDLCDWLEDQSDKADFVFASDSRATPEKIENYKAHHTYTQLVKLGDWPSNELVNNLNQVMRSVLAKDVSAKSSRANRHNFENTSSKSTGKSWDYASQAFEEFIGGNKFWLSMYQQIAEEISEDVIVKFRGDCMRHFYYAVHQAVEYPEAELSTFCLTLTDDNGLHKDVIGGWFWDGVTKPVNALKNIEGTYRSIGHLQLLLDSAVDQENYDSVYREHGFFPYVSVTDIETGESKIYGPDETPTHDGPAKRFQSFVADNLEYCQEVSEYLASVPRNFAKID